MKMEVPENLPQTKLLILYILNKVGSPITNDVLMNIYFSVNELNYFYFQQYLGDLEDKNWIANFEEDNTIYYMITPKGISLLNELLYLLSPIILKTTNTALETITRGLKFSLTVNANLNIIDINKVNVICSISEGNATLLKIEIFAGNIDEAKRIAQNWKENALKFYPDIIKILT